MNQMRVLNQSGDIRLEWDPDDETTWKAAEAEFASLVDAGFKAYLLPEGGGKRKAIKTFDPSATGDYVFAPGAKSRKERAVEQVTKRTARPRAMAGQPSDRAAVFGRSVR